MRSAIAYLSTANLLHNLSVIKKTASKSQIIAMVKANAYGHGLRSTAIRLENYTDFLGVASIDEALQLRKAGVTAKIILMEGIFEAEEILMASRENFSIVFHNQQQVDWLKHYIDSGLLQVPLHAWIKLDTGMGRLGFNLMAAQGVYQYLINNSLIMHPIGIMSHFACADNKLHFLNIEQINNFNKFFKDSFLINSTYKPIKSFCNSAGIFNFVEQHYDVVRPGIALYGVSPLSNRSSKELNLKAVMTLTSKIIAIKDLSKNSSVGYGANFVCPRATKVAVIAIGYGDGYPYNYSGKIPVLINNKLCNTIGSVSMDLLTVDITDCEDPKLGDQAILWGEELPIEEIAKLSNTSVYSLLTAVQHRVKFIWI